MRDMRFPIFILIIIVFLLQMFISHADAEKAKLEQNTTTNQQK
ncbi:MAG: hypothetical protein RBR59_00315 [Sulfurimonadaceae bacterium]|jgi:hypothetical protein|nr:hypothetical protein [Sulfurimonadaceae bacterium]